MGHLIAGALAIVLGLWGLSVWWTAFGFVMRGVLPFLALLLGLVAVMSSYSRFQNHLDVGDDLED